MSPTFDNTNSEQNKQPLIAAAYARVSTGRQENEETIESQLDEIRRTALEDGNILKEEDIFYDEGYTGELLPRPALDNLRDIAKSGRFQIFYVYDRGRIARLFYMQEIVIEEFAEIGIRFKSLHDINATTAEEKVLQSMQGVFAEYERVKIAERMRRGKLYKTRSGILINGRAPYGYNYVKKTDSAPTHFEINEDEAKIVRMVFEWVGNEGISVYEVIRRLYDMGIPPKNKKGDQWVRSSIVRMLQCEAYAKGVVHYFKSEAIVAKNPIKNTKYKRVKRTSRKTRPRDEWVGYDKVPTIISIDLHERVQAALQRYKKYAPRNKKYPYLLAGMIFCECGNLVSEMVVIKQATTTTDAPIVSIDSRLRENANRPE